MITDQELKKTFFPPFGGHEDESELGGGGGTKMVDDFGQIHASVQHHQ